MHGPFRVACRDHSKKIFAYIKRLPMGLGLVQPQYKIVDRCAITIYPYSLGVYTRLTAVLDIKVVWMVAISGIDFACQRTMRTLAEANALSFFASAT